MFVGHYSAALAAKAAEPRGPLWAYVAAAQLIDIGWGALVMAGVEKVRFDESLPGSSLDLHHMPWTHSLPAAAIWAVGAVVLCRLMKWPMRVAVMVGLVAFSHWLLDFLVHRPDLLLWPGGGKVGLGWWNYPVPEQALEIGLLGLAGMAWAWVRAKAGRSLTPALGFVAALIGLQVVVMFMPPNHDPVAFGMNAVAVYLIAAAVAWVVDRKST